MRSTLGLLLGFLATASWGSFYIVGRWLFGEEDGDTISPYLANWIRFALAVCTLSPLLLSANNRSLVKKAFTRDWKKFLLIALIGIVLESYFVLYALNFTTASRCSLMANCSPIATVLLAFFLLKEKMTVKGIIGMLIGFAGIILAGTARGGDIYADTGWRTLIGDGMALASGFCWAFFTVFGAKVSDEYGGPVSMFVSFLMGTILMTPVVLCTATIGDFQAVTPRIWTGFIYTGIITLALANACWYAALKYLKPGVLGAFGYLSAAITFTLSAIVLKEKFTWPFILAIALVLGGMALMMANPAKEEKADN
jgi:drug/metabolite transporter (DMT)-like permease